MSPAMLLPPPTASETPPSCPQCRTSMAPTGWVPRRNEKNGMDRITVFRCLGCGSIFDALWGFRQVTGQL